MSHSRQAQSSKREGLNSSGKLTDLPVFSSIQAQNRESNMRLGADAEKYSTASFVEGTSLGTNQQAVMYGTLQP